MNQFFTPGTLTIGLSIFTLISGFYLTFKSIPYNSWWSATHKIATLILIATYVMVIYPIIKSSVDAEGLLNIFWVSLVLFVLSIITGAIVVNLKSKIQWMIWAHRIFPISFFVTAAYLWNLCF